MVQTPELHWPVKLILILLIWLEDLNGDCDLEIISKLRPHVVQNALKHLRGRYRDVWVSRHLANILNCSYTDIGDQGNITSCIMYKDGRGFSATGILWEEDGIMHLEVESFKMTGLIFPVFVTQQVFGFYCCYTDVPENGVSTICVRSDPVVSLDSISQVLEAKAVFRHLHELGIPINDGVDY